MSEDPGSFCLSHCHQHQFCFHRSLHFSCDLHYLSCACTVSAAQLFCLDAFSINNGSSCCVRKSTCCYSFSPQQLLLSQRRSFDLFRSTLCRTGRRRWRHYKLLNKLPPLLGWLLIKASVRIRHHLVQSVVGTEHRSQISNDRLLVTLSYQLSKTSKERKSLVFNSCLFASHFSLSSELLLIFGLIASLHKDPWPLKPISINEFSLSIHNVTIPLSGVSRPIRPHILSSPVLLPLVPLP